MLCQFTVKNYRAIKDELTLDMQCTNLSGLKDSIIKSEDGERFLPLAAIYGPNAGGKTTVLRAMAALKSKIIRPIRMVLSGDDSIRVEPNFTAVPFEFSEECKNEPTEFEIFFRTIKTEYQYKLSIDGEKIVYESLYKKSISKTSRYSKVFERTENGGCSLSGSLKDYPVKDISDELPLLSYLGLTHSRNKTIREVIEWFSYELVLLNYGNPIRETKLSIVTEGEEKENVLKLLRAMGMPFIDYEVIDIQENEVDIITIHNIDGIEYKLNLEEESSGSIKLFGLMPHLSKAINSGGTIVIDELDAKIHPLLLQEIIRLFNDPDINKSGAQLIFTSHDLMTMNNENFRRDEIWFAAQNEDQSTFMYSLAEFKARSDEAYGKRYMERRYGADPYFKRIVEWEDEKQ